MVVAIPVYQAASPGFGANAGHINQFLGTHSAQVIYNSGTIRSQQATGIAVYSATNTQMLSTLFVTGSTQTAIGTVNLQLSTVGGSPTLPLINPITVSIYADAGGFPTGSALVSNTLSNQYVYSSPFWVTVPLPISGLTPMTNYHIVVSMVGNAGHYYLWQQSNQGGGAAISTNGGTSWTGQSFGLMYQILDQGTTGLVQYIYEDGGSRWLQLSYNSLNLLSQITEYTTAQSTTGYQLVTRTLSYTNGLLTGVN